VNSYLNVKQFKNRITPLALVLFLHFQLFSQSIVNGYAKVNSISGTTLNISNANLSGGSFTVGKKVMLIQMQDNVIGGNTGNNLTFGDIAGISSAGMYEFLTVTSVSGSTITLSSSPVNSFSFNANSSVQVVTVQDFNTTADYTTTSSITALPWDGNIGGVIAIEIPGILTLANSITADADGFRGGARSGNAATPFSSVCSSTPYSASSVDYGSKGEGIFKSSSTTLNAARGKMANAGGGGNNSNGGGGGGSNFADGGNGGLGWQCTASNAGSGIGGQSLGSYYALNRIFMGGGGGGGQMNNNASTNGGNGGGIVYVKAAQITTPPTCTSQVSITANGQSAASTAGGGNDGAGGGGAAGAIIVDAVVLNPSTGCPLIVSANAGNGGSVSTSAPHGAGGGGGQGAVIYVDAPPSTNVSTTTLNGTGGCNNNIVPCTTFASSPSAPNNTGIFTSTPLGVTLTEFNAVLMNRSGLLTWKTSSEINSDYFQVERSIDGMNFNPIAKVAAAGNSQSLLSYEYLDYNAFLTQEYYYYRLKQVDYDGKLTYSDLRYLHRDEFESNEIIVFPNPVVDLVNVYIGNLKKYTTEIILTLTDELGREVQSQLVTNDMTTLNIADYPNGMYFLNVVADERVVESKKVVK
jgi:hypothetical protein